jgi:hypothetical protein
VSDDPLKELQLRMLLDQMAERGARRFFSEHDLPAELVEGWKNYQKRVNTRQMIGRPMPPGGTFVMGVESVWAGCMAEFHTALSNLLRVPPSKIKLRVEREGGGDPRVVADVEMDALPEMNLAGEDPKLLEANRDQLLKTYLEQTVGLLNRMFRYNLKTRLAACTAIRQDVAQEIRSGAQEKDQPPN